MDKRIDQTSCAHLNNVLEGSESYMEIDGKEARAGYLKK